MPCVTVNVCPAIVIVPVRVVEPVFAATLYDTTPEPVTALPDVTVIQPTPLVAVHWQVFVEAFTVTSPVPPAARKSLLVGVSV